MHFFCVFQDKEKILFLEKEMRKVTSTIDQLVNDFNMFKEKVVELHYLVSYLTAKLMEGKKVLKETNTAWKGKEMTTELFDYLNITLPCGANCPVDFGIFHKCELKNKEQLMLEFSVPLVDQKLVRVEADAFNLMVRKDNNTCVLKYNGPTVATVSIEDDCVYETFLENTKNRVAIPTSQQCTNSSFKGEESYFKVDKCTPTKSGDEKPFVQVKIYDNQYFVYCPKGTYMIGKRSVNFPESVFTLPLSLTFTLNEVQYQGNVLKVVYREKEDPMLTQHLNYHLNPRINWSNLTAEYEMDLNESDRKINDEVKNLKLFEFADKSNELTTTSIVLIVLATLAILSLVLFIVKQKLCQGKPNTNINASVEARIEEEIPLQPTTSGTTSQKARIIIHN